MARMHGLGEFDRRLTLEAPFGVKYVIYRKGDTFDGDGGSNAHPWRWLVSVGGRDVDFDTSHRFSEYTDNWGFTKTGFPTAEDAYEHMAQNARDPRAYAESDREAQERGADFLGSIADGTFSTGMPDD